MPNWVTNRLNIHGPADQVAIFFDKVKCNEREFDFECITPMPESLKIVSGSTTSDAQKLLRGDDVENLMQRYPDEGDAPDPSVFYGYEKHPETMPELRVYAEIIRSNEEKYGMLDWYDWAYFRWGTKWNACNSWRTGNKIGFDTAWSTPDGIIEALPSFLASINCDQISIEWAWAEEQGFFGGYYYIEPCDDGYLINQDYFEDNDDAYDLCETLLGYSTRSVDNEGDDWEDEDFKESKPHLMRRSYEF